MSARSNWTWNRSPVPSSSSAAAAYLSLATPRNTNRRRDDRRAPSPRNRRIQIYPALMNSWFVRRLIGNNGNNERAVICTHDGVVGAQNRSTTRSFGKKERAFRSSFRQFSFLSINRPSNHNSENGWESSDIFHLSSLNTFKLEGLTL